MEVNSRNSQLFLSLSLPRLSFPFVYRSPFIQTKFQFYEYWEGNSIL